MSRWTTSVVIMVMALLTGACWSEKAIAESSAPGDQLFKLTALDAAANDEFGFVAISGNTAIVGSYRDGHAGANSGSAYLFDVTTGNQLFKLTALDAAAGDQFGRSVAISGNVAIVGAHLDADAGSSSGSAYLFDVTTGNQLLKLSALDAAAGDAFGIAVAISGNKAIVGAWGDDDAGSSSGSAYLFDVTTGNQLFKLSALDAAWQDNFGIAVAISGNMTIVGARYNDDGGNASGSAYLFDVTTGNQTFKLTALDAAADDVFGNAVAISGNTAIVGAWGDDDGGNTSGSAYLFDVTTGNQLFKLTALDAAASDAFGISVAIDGNTAVAGATGNDDGGQQSGSAYLLDVTTGNQLLKLTALDAAASDGFGSSVGISGNTAIVGAPGDDDGGSNSGSAYLFEVESPVPVRLASFSVQRGGPGAVLAWEVADATDHAGFHVYRQLPGDVRVRLTEQLLFGQRRYQFQDVPAPRGAADYWLAEIGRTGATSWHGPVTLSAAAVSPGAALAALPNPFRSTTRIAYSLAESQRINLSIFDIHGRRVRTLHDRVQDAGDHVASWDGRTGGGMRAAFGLYLVKLDTGGKVITRKVVLTP